MKYAYVFKDEKSHKFWVIDYDETLDYLCVNFGKVGTAGKYQIKEFDDNEECKKQAQKLINSKIKKGYTLTDDFDFINHLYFDDIEHGLDEKTSHPNFTAHFKDEIYLSCYDEESPFGNDAGADTFADLEEYIRKHGDKDILKFPYKVMMNWGYQHYIPPTHENTQEATLKELLDNDSDFITQLDRVIIATAFGQIKIMGKINPELKELALLALERIKKSFVILGYGDSKITQMLYRDLENFKQFI